LHDLRGIRGPVEQQCGGANDHPLAAPTEAVTTVPAEAGSAPAVPTETWPTETWSAKAWSTKAGSAPPGSAKAGSAEARSAKESVTGHCCLL
jgi:hypothetical protein